MTASQEGNKETTLIKSLAKLYFILAALSKHAEGNWI